MSDFTCYVVEKDQDQVKSGLSRRSLSDLPEGEVLIRVHYSSLNYKDGLAATGKPGVARKFPHIPGIDAAGEVAESTSPEFQKGQKVLVTGYDLGAGRWGGWSEYARVPAEWVIPLPPGLSLVESMQLGTAGFTAALSVYALRHHEITPQSGEIVVTGATGGVGCLAVSMLGKLGYTVVAVTGKADRHDWLKELGAARVIGRGDVDVKGGNPLLKAAWGGAVDTVGGNVLATLLRSTQIGGCVTACGLVRPRAGDNGVSVHPAGRHALGNRHRLVSPRTSTRAVATDGRRVEAAAVSGGVEASRTQRRGRASAAHSRRTNRRPHRRPRERLTRQLVV